MDRFLSALITFLTPSHLLTFPPFHLSFDPLTFQSLGQEWPAISLLKKKSKIVLIATIEPKTATSSRLGLIIMWTMSAAIKNSNPSKRYDLR